MNDSKLTKHHLSTRIYMGYLLYVAENYPEIKIEEICQQAGLPIEYIRNPHNWVSVTFDSRFMSALKAVTNDPELEYKVGAFSVSKSCLGPLYVIGRHVLTLNQVYSLVATYAGHLNKVTTFQVPKFRGHQIVLTMTPNYESLDQEEHAALDVIFPTIIKSTAGYYSAFPRLKKLKDAEVVWEKIGETYQFNINFPRDAVSYFIISALIFLAPLSFAASYFLGTSLASAWAIAMTAVVGGLGLLIHARYQGAKELTEETQNQLQTIRTQNEDLQSAQRQLKLKYAASEAVNKITSHLIAAADETTILNSIAKDLAETLSFDRVLILLKDKHGIFLEFAAGFLESSDLSEQLKKVKFETNVASNDPAKIANVYNQRKAVLIENVRQHLPTLNAESRYILEKSGSKSFLAAPIFTTSETMGVLIADNLQSDRALTTEDLKTAEVAAKQIGSVLQRIGAEREAERAHQETEMLAKAASRFVPFELINLLGCESVTQVQLGQNSSLKMAVLFADIREFTTLVETMNAQDTGAFLNSYYGSTAPIIKRNGGIIDKFLGDGLLAVFKDPNEAVEAAIQFQKQVQIYNDKHRSGGKRKIIATGIGIHFDNLLVSAIGYEERLSVTVTSDGVNYAARIDELNKIFKSGVLCSSAVIENIRDKNEARYLAKVRVRGRKADDSIYEIIGHLDDATRHQRKLAEPMIREVSDALSLYRYDIALRLIKQAKLAFPTDPIFDYYQKSVQEALSAKIDGVLRAS